MRVAEVSVETCDIVARLLIMVNASFWGRLTGVLTHHGRSILEVLCALLLGVSSSHFMIDR